MAVSAYRVRLIETSPLMLCSTIIGRRLDNIAKRPMTSHEVQEVLGISARERIRWTKDNRLRTSGTFTARRQQIVTLNTYAADYPKPVPAP
jgi:hypothetical protein